MLFKDTHLNHLKPIQSLEKLDLLKDWDGIVDLDEK